MIFIYALLKVHWKHVCYFVKINYSLFVEDDSNITIHSGGLFYSVE